MVSPGAMLFPAVCLWLVVMFASILESADASKMFQVMDEPQASETEDSIASLVAVAQASETKDSIASLVAVASKAVQPANSSATGPRLAPKSYSPGPGPMPAAPRPAPELAAPGLAPGPGPEPGPLEEVAASPFGGDMRPARKPDLTKRLVGVNYHLLSANEPLKTSFEVAVKSILAAQVEGGLEPKDVTLRLSPGSIIIDAWFSNPQSLSVLTKEKLRQTLCQQEANLDSELLGAVSSLPGLKEATTQDLYLEKAAQCRSTHSHKAKTPAKRSQPTRKAQASNVTAGDACDPPCLHGRGICGGDKVCFCHHPYTGVQCEHEIEPAMMRIKVLYVTILLCTIAMSGMLLANCIWQACLKFEDGQRTPECEENDNISRKNEVWKAQHWPSVKKHAGH